MKLEEIRTTLEADTLCREGLLESVAVEYAYASDLMSDVLAFARPGSLLLTGLTNLQIVRTAQMMDMPAVVFVRGKQPRQEAVELAEKMGIPLLSTCKSMYEASGLLLMAGILPCEIPRRERPQ
ncbi:MAG: transcriptional regulator [Synergistales bacterium]|nr:transcriptional regulator [Synergistales bacterium]